MTRWRSYTASALARPFSVSTSRFDSANSTYPCSRRMDIARDTLGFVTPSASATSTLRTFPFFCVRRRMVSR